MTNAVNITVALSKVIVFTIFANTLYVNFVVDRGKQNRNLWVIIFSVLYLITSI